MKRVTQGGTTDDSQLSVSQWSISHRSKQSVLSAVVVAAVAFLVAYPAGLRAQDTGSSMPQTAQQAAGALTGDQQSAANSARE
jgi:hypothetical protein